MLHTIDPLTSVLTAIGIGVGTLPMLLIELIVAFVLAAILPHIGSETMHDSVLERTLEVAPICPLECPIAAHLVVGPNACILASISPKVDTLTLFNTVLEEAVVIATIAPYLDSFAILLLHSGHL